MCHTFCMPFTRQSGTSNSSLSLKTREAELPWCILDKHMGNLCLDQCHTRALDSFFPLVAILQLTFSVGHTSTSFGRNFCCCCCYNMGLINACWLTLIIVYSYIVTKVFNFQPVLFFISIFCDFKFCEQEFLLCYVISDRALSLSFSNSRSWFQLLQEKITVLLITIHLSIFKTFVLKQKMD